MRPSRVNRNKKSIHLFQETFNYRNSYHIQEKQPSSSLYPDLNDIESSSISQESYHQFNTYSQPLKEFKQKPQTFIEHSQSKYLQKHHFDIQTQMNIKQFYIFESRQGKMMEIKEINQQLKNYLKHKKINIKDPSFQKILNLIKKTETQNTKLTFQDILDLDQAFMSYQKWEQINDQVTVCGINLE